MSYGHYDDLITSPGRGIIIPGDSVSALASQSFSLAIIVDTLVVNNCVDGTDEDLAFDYPYRLTVNVGTEADGFQVTGLSI